jgi:predicted MFS family arabinose efflux permease
VDERHPQTDDLKIPRAGLVLLVLSAAQSLVVIDGIPVAIALPAIRDDFALSSTELQWVVNGYVLALAGGLLLFGRCADLFGRRLLLVVGLAVLTAASLLAGLAPTGLLLVLARVVQGLGAAMVLPASLALVPTLFVATGQRDRAFAAIALVESAAWIIGTLAGGIVTGLLGWRYVFLITVPLSLGALVLARRVLPESRDDQARGRLDIAGAVTITAGLALAVYGTTQLRDAGAMSGTLLGAGALTVALVGAFVLVERRVTEPLIDMQLLRVPRLWGASLGVAANTAAYTAVVFVGTLYLQEIRGVSPTTTALVFLTLGVGALVSPALARLLARASPRLFAVTGLLLCAVTLAGLGVFAASSTPPVAGTVLLLLVFGVAQYGAWLALVGQATTDVEPRQYGVASGVFKTSTHVGAAIAVAVYATTIEAVGGDSPGDGRPYAFAFLAAAALTVCGAFATWSLIRDGDRHRGSGHQDGHAS